MSIAVNYVLYIDWTRQKLRISINVDLLVIRVDKCLKADDVERC